MPLFFAATKARSSISRRSTFTAMPTDCARIDGVERSTTWNSRLQTAVDHDVKLRSPEFGSRCCSASKAAGATKNWPPTPPSTCISWNFLPLPSTSISTGGKAPGMLPEASSTLRNRLSAASPSSVGGVRGDGAHVPDHGALGIEIGGDHEQTPAAAIFGGDIGQQRRRDLFGDQILQRPGIDEAFAGAADLENVGRGDLGIGGLQGVVVARAGKGERRHQRAGAHAGDDGIIRPLAGGAQAVEQAGAEGAVGAAGREDEPRARLRRQRLLKSAVESAQNRASGMPGIDGGGIVGGGEWRARRQLVRRARPAAGAGGAVWLAAGLRRFCARACRLRTAARCAVAARERLPAKLNAAAARARSAARLWAIVHCGDVS